ncbi:glycosyl transferase family protein [Roseivivax marinus]|uniref:glycosyl transferase family protein n=1 Tax=Roseivivax marinus TaxID=1379903 RepID=UPI001F044D71|nr:glycosyl transferase family protein [Roseivivax marinus]UMA66236.1 glycosyl transferase family protein [Roseivivax marinus]
MSLASYVRILGRGQGRARGFTRDEAREAMSLMMQGDADPEAVGAILMLLRMKGETADEIAGFAEAARGALLPWWGTAPALDWPSYAAGRTRGLPWFLLAAKLVAEAGYPVLLHGWNSHQSEAASVRAALPALGISVASGQEDAATRLEVDGIVYLPLEVLSPRLFALLGLRDVLGLRSCINTVLRMLNPGGARAAVQGVFHPPYRELQADAAQLLGLRDLTVLKGGGGEFEHHPAKDIQTFGVRAGLSWRSSTGTQVDARRRLSEGAADPGHLGALWDGTRHDAFAEAIVLSTADLALETLGAATDAYTLWSVRRARAA